MKLLLTFPPVENTLAWEGAEFVRSVTRLFERGIDKGGHSLTTSPEEADVILYLEPQQLRDRAYAELLLREDFVRRFPAKCFSYSYADFFIGFLPGLHTCLTRPHAGDPRYGSWNYLLGLPNPLVEKMAPERDRHPAKLLFTFRGSNSAAVRNPILANAGAWSSFARITELDGKHFHKVPVEKQREYVEEIFESRFVLCPRGLGCSSHRLFETMALGRVPVVISDAWVEPDGPAWKEFSVRVAEKDAARLPEILRPLEAQAGAMGRRAREEWEYWFSPDVAMRRFMDRLATLVAAQPRTQPDYKRLWRSWSFYTPYGLSPHQKMWRNLCNGGVLRKIGRKLGLAKS